MARIFSCSVAIALVCAIPSPAQIHTTELAAKVTIEGAVASTSLTLVVRNEGTRVGEADWILPLPDGAVVDGFEMENQGVKLASEVLDATRAQAVYESIVRRKRDPGLLEFAGRGCLRARVFPIPAGGETTVQIRFRQVLPLLDGMTVWSLPLSAAGADGARPERCTVDVRLSSPRSIRNVFTTMPGMQVLRPDDHRAHASFEGDARQVGGARDIDLWFGTSDKDFGVDVISTKRPDQPGYFLMLIAPKLAWQDSKREPRTVTFALDTSGSMAGKKIEQARRALEFFVETLEPGDFFNVVPFATEAEPFFPAPVAADAESVATALARIESLRALGGTNIESALQRSLVPPSLGTTSSITLFLTDGMPSVGERGSEALFASAKLANTGNSRLFVFGVGNDVNTVLLDELALQNGGAQQYVRPTEDIEVKTSDLLTKISHPVMASLEIDIDGVQVTKRVPQTLPDLFRGSRMSIVGRYDQGGESRRVTLRGEVGGRPVEFGYDISLAVEPNDNEFVPALWAERRTALLLDQIRRHGRNQELVDEIERLGRRFQIVTPYTSHLIVEDGALARFGGSGASTSLPGGGGATGGPVTGRRPGPGGPTTPGQGGPASPGGGRGAELDVEQIADVLIEQGVLATRTSRREARRVATNLVHELRSSSDRMAGLQRHRGARAVEDSLRLSNASARQTVMTDSVEFFMGAGKLSDSSIGAERGALLALFVQRVGDKVFRMREGVWVDDALIVGVPPGHDPNSVKPTLVRAYEPEYFALLREHPGLRRYLAISDRIRVVFGGAVFEVLPPKEVLEEGATDR